MNNKNLVNCSSCNYCAYCRSCSFCNFCDSCNSCYSCKSCNSCYFCKNIRLSERMIFCDGDGKYVSNGQGYQKNNMVFNTQVTREEFDTIRSALPKIELKNLNTLLYEESWALAWSETSQEDKDKIMSIPHFNAEIFKGITGIDIAKKEPETIKIGGKEYIVTDELKSALDGLEEKK